MGRQECLSHAGVPRLSEEMGGQECLPHAGVPRLSEEMGRQECLPHAGVPRMVGAVLYAPRIFADLLLSCKREDLYGVHDLAC